MAQFTFIAFSNASLVSISLGRTFFFTISTIRIPLLCASAFLRESTAGMAAFCANDIPNACFLYEGE
jgi:hypothetical protein